MLQQTQVDRVIEKYKEFIGKFPTIHILAHAQIEDVLRAWFGLGYNRRALFLQRAAKYIIENFKGVFPQKVEDIEKLPGVGSYTARAVCAFAFNKPEIFIETNIRRIYIHHFFSSTSSRVLARDPDGMGRKMNDKKISDKDLIPIVEKTLYKKNPHLWYSALMDYGSVEFKNILNPNKKSKHYSRQSKFEGSQRQARAYILKNILAHGSASLGDIQAWLKARPSTKKHSSISIVRRILKEMEQEGFLEVKRGKWVVKTQF